MSIKIARQEVFDKKLSQIKKGGVEKLHVVSDFEKTLTKPKTNGLNGNSSFERVREGAIFPPQYAVEGAALYQEYYHYQNDPGLSLEERSVKMREWWSKELQLLIKHGITKDIIKQVVTVSGLEPRDGLASCIEHLHKNKVPLLIFSSWLGDGIQAFLEAQKMLFPNIHIIANFFEYSSSGKAVGVKQPIIHPFNKHENEITGADYSKEVKDRKNVIVLGHTISDLGIPAGFKHDTVLNIGFWNEDWDVAYGFKRRFDVIVESDDDMNYVVDLIKNI